jgi:hypothetical protein
MQGLEGKGMANGTARISATAASPRSPWFRWRAIVSIVASNLPTSVVVYRFKPDTMGSAHGGSVLWA